MFILQRWCEGLPRLPPSQVIEHRISFSNKERDQIELFAKAYNRDKWLENTGNILTGAGVVGIGAAIAYGAYWVGSMWGTVEDKLEVAQDTTRRAIKQTIVDPFLYWASFTGLTEDPYKDEEGV